MAHRKPATLKEVAAYAGVSIKTVSNVVNDWPYVSEETRQKVLEAIQAVGYRPNQAARSLVTGKTRTVGVLIPDIANPFFGAAIRGCEDVLFEGGYSLLLSNTNEDLSRERDNIDLLLSRGVDSLLLWGTHICCDELEQIIGPNLPLVTIELGEAPNRPTHANINVDNQYGAGLATRHLIEQGYTTIAHLQGPEERVTARLRLAGYRQSLEQAGLPFDEQLVRSASPTIPGGYQAALDLLQRSRPPALFCYNDLMAFGALIAARELGLDVPGDLAIVGFDDIPMAAFIEPAFSTVRIAQYDLGHLAGETILKLLNQPPAQPLCHTFPVELVVRSSSRSQPFSAEERQVALRSLLSSYTPGQPNGEPGYTPRP
ncbi:MAG: LacI family DNA-binding transcriptional regulator [Chloroflexota bacterium]